GCFLLSPARFARGGFPPGRPPPPPRRGGGGGGGGAACDASACGGPPSPDALRASTSPRTRGEVTLGATACPSGDDSTVAGAGASARCSITVPWSSPASGSFHSKASSRPLTGEIGSQ